MTQDQLAAKCQLKGLDIGRATLAQIEARIRCVKDRELFLIAKVLRVKTDDLFPKGTGARI